MVCQRCINAVANELSELGLKVEEIALGHAVYTDHSDVSLEVIAGALKKQGFELIQNTEEKLVERVKILIIQLLHPDSISKNIAPENESYSKYLSKETGKTYSYLSRVFSRHTKCTIEKYIILQRIEKVKELIEYGDLSFSEIAYALGYKSAAHLSNQFKEITGMSMGKYKENPGPRKPLDKI